MVRLANSQDVNNVDSLNNLVWAALEKIAGKQKQPDELPQGSSHQISLRLVGEVDGEPFEQQLESVLTIGHEQTRSSSVTPQVPELLAYILSKLNRATRSRLLTDIPQDFVDNDCRLPEPRPVLIEDAKYLLKRLRTSRKVKARGPIRCQYTL